jgi:hypothetical protein
MAGGEHVVLVVHGVAHRTPADFQDEIDALNPALAPRAIVPVFWGDLGPADATASFPVIEGSIAIDRGDDDDADSSLRARLRRITDAVDALSPESFATGLRRTIARTVRDVEAYESNGESIRARLDEAYRTARGDAERVDVVAHSLGGLVAVEWLFGAPAGNGATAPGERRIHTLVTFGTQVGLFCELRGLQGPPGTIALPPAPISLTVALRRWCNVWHALDPLAFAAAPAFTVAGRDGPVGIEDYRLPVHGVPESAAFHTAYWRDLHFGAWLDRTL